jgi:hypothetical protein
VPKSCDPRAGGNDERVGRAREHLSGSSGRCPDDIVGEQRVVGEGSQLLGVPEGRYGAHRVTGRVPTSAALALRT